MEEATEFGEPRAIREAPTVLKLGYTFRDFDKATRFTWKALRAMTSEQVASSVSRILEMDNRLVKGAVLRRLFGPTTVLNDWNIECYGLWSGDSMVPPPYLGKTFDSSHSHYLTSQSTVIDSQDIEAMLHHVREHGYGDGPGTQMLIFAHPDDVDAAALTSWRAGVEYRTGGPLPKYDFIPSALMPAWISDEQIHGPIPNADYNGLQVHGSYAGALLIQSNIVPKGYVAVVASGGLDSTCNPVGFRQHSNTSYQGLRQIPGRGPYPLQDSFFARGFGVGVRHRGAAVVGQITTGSTYASPTIPV